MNDAPVALSGITTSGEFEGAGVSGSLFDPEVAGVGTHTITHVIDGPCGDSATFEVTVFDLPNVGFTANKFIGCAPLTVQFTNLSDAGVVCSWDFGDGGAVDFCGAVEHTYLNDGTFDVTLTVTDTNTCQNTLVYADYIAVTEMPEAVFSFDPQVLTVVDTEVQFTDLSYGASSWHWFFGNLDESNAQHPTYIFPKEAGEYEVKLVVEGAEGCLDSIVRNLVIAEKYLAYIPNVFTPDGNNYNEAFRPYFSGIDIYNYKMSIYNRWGELIFVSQNAEIGWNGTYGGEIVPAGVYIYHIETAEIVSDKKIDYHGHVTVLK